MTALGKQLFLVFIFFNLSSCAQKMSDKNYFTWKQLAPIPDLDGFAGSYAGISGNALIVAGGANFPDGKRPWTNGVKTWYDKIFVLDRPDGVWKELGRLPRPMGYGVALTYKDALICVGGGDAGQNYADVFMLSYVNGKIETAYLPPMPEPLINAAGVISGDLLYIMGGIKSPTGLTENIFISIDLAGAVKSWKSLEPFPGHTRMLATSGSQDGRVFFFGGVHLFRDEKDGSIKREYLKDCWEYTRSGSWKRIADLPNPLAAAPSPAYVSGKSCLVIFGGDDGALAPKTAELKDKHPGFRNDIIEYNIETDRWTVLGMVPTDRKDNAETTPNGSVYMPVTTPLVTWNGNAVIPGGEARPAVRTNKVLVASPVVK